MFPPILSSIIYISIREKIIFKFFSFLAGTYSFFCAGLIHKNIEGRYGEKNRSNKNKKKRPKSRFIHQSYQD